MEYNKIVAITGLTGLYELLNSKTDGAIVRSLDDNSTKFVASRVHNFSHLESIEVYTVKENINLADLFKAMEQHTEKVPDTKDSKAVKIYFQIVYPDMDFERVYISDMKKMIKWYDLLQGKVEFKVPEPEANETADEDVVKEDEKADESTEPVKADKEK
ncbi:MAG: DUF5606 domain-containing protein [Chitinophagaceae bacterium]